MGKSVMKRPSSAVSGQSPKKVAAKAKAKVRAAKPKAGPKVRAAKPKAGPKVKVVKPKGPPKGAVKVGGSGGEPLKRKTKHDKDKKDDAFFVHAANQPEWARELLDMSLIGNS